MIASLSEVLRQPWYPHLHEFNLLPSRRLHDTWAAHFSPHDSIRTLRTTLDDDSALHRHWSDYILDLLGLASRPWLDCDASQLPLAIMPLGHFEQVVLSTGAVLAGGAIRRAIMRDEIAAIEQRIGSQTFYFARTRGADYHPGLALPADMSAVDFAGQAQLLGSAALLHGLRGAPDELFERVRLRLQMDTPVVAYAPLSEIAPIDALDLMLRLTNEVAPEWLSFCATTT